MSTEKGNIFHPSLHNFSFKVGAPSMVYGKNTIENVQQLSDNTTGLHFVEIVLFHTPTLHNIPTSAEIQVINEIGKLTDTTYTVHLPSSLEIGSENQEVRENSIRLLVDIWSRTIALDPAYYILHIPITKPTLVPVPGEYFYSDSSCLWDGWTSRALESLERIRKSIGGETVLLFENINYSPKFLRPFLDAGCGQFCLDVGHLMLGDENVLEVLDSFWDDIREIHLHGVIGYSEHLSIDVLPRDRVAKLLSRLYSWDYRGAVNLEVFTPEDLQSSLAILSSIMREMAT